MDKAKWITILREVSDICTCMSSRLSDPGLGITNCTQQTRQKKKYHNKTQTKGVTEKEVNSNKTIFSRSGLNIRIPND